VFDSVGLDAEHLVVYELLLGAPSADIGELARSSALAAPDVRRIVDDLERLGLAARQAQSPDRVVASPPTLALRPLLLEHERRLNEAHELLVRLSELYRSGAAQRSAPDVVDIVLGAPAVLQRIEQLQASAVEQVRALVLREVALLEGGDNAEEDRALARGVRYRVIVETAVVDRPGFLASVREALPRGEEVRVLPELPSRLFIADDSLALLPMHSHDTARVSGALLIHPSALFDVVSAMFEEHWRMATPLVVEHADHESEDEDLDRDLLRLLLLGLTEATAASQLGVSPRTVQRRVSDLMAKAGVMTRIQLGAEAVRRGWV
jgi:DNA-binding CsgD family transcriptional regulator/sugar-specific transcriptional regulator TrmB